MSDIKIKLIQEIEKIDDEFLLEQIRKLITKPELAVTVEFNRGQIEQIRQSQEQVEKGEFFDHDEVMKMFEDD